MKAPIQYGIVQTGEPVKTGVACVRVVDLTEPELSAKRAVRVSETIHRKYAKTTLEKHDLLFALRGEVGVVREVTPDLIGANIHRGVARLSVDPTSASSRFLMHALQAPSVRMEMAQRLTGSALQEMPINQLRKLRVPVPDLDAQKRIATALDAMDHRILTVTRLLEAKRRFKRGLMKKLVLGERRFAQFEFTLWSEYTIGSLLETVERPIEWDNSAAYDLLSVRRRSGGVFHRGTLKGSHIATKVLFEAHENDVLISRMQAVHGAIGIVRRAHHGMKVSGSYIVLRPRPDAPITPSFFAWLTRLPAMYRAVLQSSYGVHIEKMTFNLDWYLKTRIRAPQTIEEQDTITSLLESMEDEEAILERMSEKLDYQKRALLDKLLSGEITIPASV